MDFHKISEMLINELRAGKLGRITLEYPAMIEAENILIAETLARKAAETAERKRRFKQGSRGAQV